MKTTSAARAVASVAGTAGWEAVNRSTPALVFGYAWYRFCEGVFYTPTMESCRAALKEIADGYTVDQNKLRAYVKAIDEQGIPKFYQDPKMLDELGETRYIEHYADKVSEQLNAERSRVREKWVAAS